MDRNLRAIDAQPLAGRRPSLALLPVPRERKQSSNLEFDLGDADHNHLVNSIRSAVGRWRQEFYPEITGVTRQLLNWWSQGRTRHRLFFAQREAIETIVFLTESRSGRALARKVAEASRPHNDEIVRWAVKMATGTGKTVVMAMIIAWQALNARRSRGERYSRSFLAIAPGHTVRERLQALRPSVAGNIYDEFGLIPPRFRAELSGIALAIVNFQALQRRDLLSGSSNVAKKVLHTDLNSGSVATEDAAAMLSRVLRDLRGRDKLVVLNDEAHHCYLPGAERQGSLGKEDDKVAAVWFNAIRDLRDQGRLGSVYDLSATPMFIATAANKKALLFPWTVSDFPLLDAIESGLVKIPRLPVDDNAAEQDEVVNRELYRRTSPKKVQPHKVPEPFGAAMRALYQDYLEHFAAWQQANMPTPPVFIVVANNISNARAIYRHIAGYQSTAPDEDSPGEYVPGAFEHFSNVRADGTGYRQTLRTLLVHSKLDSDDEITGQLGRELREQAARLGSPSGEAKAAIRNALNTVGRLGGAGEQIRCVVSVSMLTEGWDTRTVTHVLGYRAFGTQLLCEQVTGRALRRVNFDNLDEDGRFAPEYAEVFGVPFDFMPTTGRSCPRPPPERYAVESVPGRSALRITFPKLTGYLIEPGAEGVQLDPERITPHAIRVEDTPTVTVVEGTIGTSDEVAMPILRRQSAVFKTAESAARLFAGDANRRRALFSDMVRVTQQYLASDRIVCDDPALLTHPPHGLNVPARIAAACVGSASPSRPVGEFETELLANTEGVWFETSLRDRYGAVKSELNVAACHSRFECSVAEHLDGHDDIRAWVRNFRLGWTIPYVFASAQREYEPDFVARLFGDEEDLDCVHLLIEVKGVPDEQSDAKAAYVRDWWIPSVSNSPQVPAWLRSWVFVQIEDLGDAWRQLDRAIERARHSQPRTIPA
ncbi:MAG: DEAD/DEAH box helicase family protein [Chloroflexota bacterium]|nr:DEAD/DEAH box helicase family protein [Chloroflexota bacterium]MDE2936683.1 DEAD/DEAH box helicase family protein [Chloroflexota bacterium]